MCGRCWSRCCRRCSETSFLPEGWGLSSAARLRLGATSNFLHHPLDTVDHPTPNEQHFALSFKGSLRRRIPLMRPAPPYLPSECHYFLHFEEKPEREIKPASHGHNCSEMQQMR